MKICLQTRGLKKTYVGATAPANDGVDLTIHEGEIYGLLGANGAGKSTFVKMIMGLLQPTGGSVQFLGYDVVTNPEAIKPYVGYMSQRAFGLSHLKVHEVITASAVLRGLSARDAQKSAKALIEEFSLDPHRDKLLSHLSLGLLRTVSFVIAIVGSPKVVVLDEPTESLDVARRRHFWRKLNEIREQQGTTVILVTHNIGEAEQILDRMAVMTGGRILAEGTPREMLRSIDNRLRVSLTFQEQSDLTEDELKEISSFGEFRRLRPGQYLMLFAEQHLAAVMSRVYELNLFDRLGDIRVSSADLEDVYLQLAGESFELR